MVAVAYNAVHSTLYARLVLWLKSSTRDVSIYNGANLGGNQKSYAYTFNGEETSYGIHLWDGFSEPRAPGFNMFIGEALPVHGRNNPQMYRAPFSINVIVLQSANMPETAYYISRELAGKVQEAIRGGGPLYDLSSGVPVATGGWWRVEKNVSIIPLSNIRKDGLIEYAVRGFVIYRGDQYAS